MNGEIKNFMWFGNLLKKVIIDWDCMPKLDAYVSWCFKVGMINILKLGMNL
jgi:hypothetical protein